MFHRLNDVLQHLHKAGDYLIQSECVTPRATREPQGQKRASLGEECMKRVKKKKRNTESEKEETALQEAEDKQRRETNAQTTHFLFKRWEKPHDTVVTEKCYP